MSKDSSGLRAGIAFALASLAALLAACSDGPGIQSQPGDVRGASASPVQQRPAVSASSSPTRTESTRARAAVQRPLAGRTIVLDPGHNALNSVFRSRANAFVPAGGFWKPCNTSGTSTDLGYPEHAFNFDVAIRTAALLRQQGARVVLTRNDDHGFGPCVNGRAAIANKAHADAAISIHADGAGPSGFGFHVIEPGVAPDGGNRDIIAPSRRLARDLRSAFLQTTGEPYSNYTGSQGLTRRTDLGGLNLARVPAVFVECGNMRNAHDVGRLTSPIWRQRAAAGIDRALVVFLTSNTFAAAAQ